MNILMLTSVYPSLDDKNENVTKVVQYFVKEWASAGHNVKVIHNVHRYPLILHSLPSRIKQVIASKINFYIPDRYSIKRIDYQDGDIEVSRLPILKLKPHGNHPKRSIRLQVDRICELIDKSNFVPDIIMGHWMSPQIQLISELKKIYHCRTSLVLHGRTYINDPKFNVYQYLSGIDALGCRSKSEAEYIMNTLGLKNMPFVCYSGVPDKFVEQYHFNTDKFSSVPDEWRFIYVGRLVKYKNIDKVLNALAHFSDIRYRFDIVGAGAEEENLKELAHTLNIDEHVIFHGRVSREEVLKMMSEAHCFTMVSKGEVFGLVYLEAMTASCVVIGSKGEGIDGVIEDGENGFLCVPADEASLEQALTHLFSMSAEELYQVSKKGFLTASKFTDKNVAEWYLKDACGEIANENNPGFEGMLSK